MKIPSIIFLFLNLLELLRLMLDRLYCQIASFLGNINFFNVKFCMKT